jgi:hypothetical protein
VNHRWRFTDELIVEAEDPIDGQQILAVLSQAARLHGIPRLSHVVRIRCESSVGAPSHADGELRLPAKPELDVILHELGHLIDWALMDDERARQRGEYRDLDSNYISQTDCELIEPWLGALKASGAYRRLRGLRDDVHGSCQDPTRWRSFWGYLVDPVEQFAVAYTQWMLSRIDGGEAHIEAYSREMQQGWGHADLCHWAAEDFEPIDQAMTALLMDPLVEREQLLIEAEECALIEA